MPKIRTSRPRPFKLIPPGRYEVKITKGKQRNKKLFIVVDVEEKIEGNHTIESRSYTADIPGKRAQTTQGERKEGREGAAQGQEAGAGKESDFAPATTLHNQRLDGAFHSSSPSPLSTRELLASSTSLSLEFGRCLSAHSDALYAFERVDISNETAAKRAADDLFTARARLITARQRVLDLNRHV